MGTANLLFIVGLIVVIGGLIVWVAIITVRAKRMTSFSDARLDAELQGIASNPPVASAMSAEATPRVAPLSNAKEARLAELSALREKGTITDDELAAARAKILAE